MRNIDITQYSSPEELYDDQSKKFNLWWILFSCFLGVLCILLFSMFIEFALRKDHYINHYIEAFSSSANHGSNVTDFDNQASLFYTRKFAFSIVTVFISLGMFIWHMISYIIAIKKKDFGKYSPWLSTLYTFIITFVVINLFFSIGGFFRFPSWDVNRILNFIFTIMLPIGYFVFYWPCSKIMRMFRYLRAQQQLKQLGINGNPFNMFPQMFENNQNQNLNNNQTESNNFNPDEKAPLVILDKKEETKIDYRSQLNTLDDKQLIAMAQKLNIFGASELSRNELIEKIILIFQSNENSKESKPKDSNSSITKEETKEINELDSKHHDSNKDNKDDIESN
ncbi:hypothetical protein [Metamycoplasma auris]|uniref:Rho termination factor N-terminal domain-containing protein n=1 Tax=Metamycoplasma auris TaxID=51363 RepID=A0A2W7G5P0_9BACT|nr:hypothetical protein [Metamycoplasma auris]PZW01577.1 hypothetical protein BCF89_101107 [Metamycoplasma auris]